MLHCKAVWLWVHFNGSVSHSADQLGPQFSDLSNAKVTGKSVATYSYSLQACDLQTHIFKQDSHLHLLSSELW